MNTYIHQSNYVTAPRAQAVARYPNHEKSKL